MSVLTISVTERGRALAERLPFEHVHGRAAETVRTRWAGVEAFVLVLATGAAVRLVGPLLVDKHADPAVVCVDDAGRYSVSLCGGHARGANDLARQIAVLLGAEPVITTATDATGNAGLDDLPGLAAVGDVAGVTRALLDGRSPIVENPLGWPLPSHLVAAGAGWVPGTQGDQPGPERVVVSDLVHPSRPGTVVLHPPSLVAGIGTSSDAPPAEVAALLRAALAGAVGDAPAAPGGGSVQPGGGSVQPGGGSAVPGDEPLAMASVAEVATIDRRSASPAIVALGLPVRSFGAAQLAEVAVPSPSSVVAAAVGTPSVCEAAALLASGPGGTLVVPKQRAAHCTVAIARRTRPRGHLAVVGLGPGSAAHRTPAATAAVRRAQVVVGYRPYLDQCAELLSPHQQVVASRIGDEVARAELALAEARAGRRVALVCSGDPGIYAMASITLELTNSRPNSGRYSDHYSDESCDDPVANDFDLEVVPGVTAGLAAAALLGAPLGHDHAVISLSDLLTEWDVIETRLRAAALADLVIVLYNPRSLGRDWQLEKARQVLLGHRAPDTPVGVVTDIARVGQSCSLTTLEGLDVEAVGMTTCVVVGSSATRVANGRMFTPRGYTGRVDSRGHMGGGGSNGTRRPDGSDETGRAAGHSANRAGW